MTPHHGVVLLVGPPPTADRLALYLAWTAVEVPPKPAARAADTIRADTRPRKGTSLRYRLYRLRDAMWRKTAHLLPPRLKYLAAIDLVAGVSTMPAMAERHVPDIRAMDAIALYEKRHGIR